MNPESMRSTYTRSRSGIQSTQSGFKVIGFTNSERWQAGKPVGDKEVMAYLADKLVVLNDNGLTFMNNVEYAWAKLMQDSKMTKQSTGMFFNNSWFDTHTGTFKLQKREWNEGFVDRIIIW